MVCTNQVLVRGRVSCEFHPAYIPLIKCIGETWNADIPRNRNYREIVFAISIALDLSFERPILRPDLRILLATSINVQPSIHDE